MNTCGTTPACPSQCFVSSKRSLAKKESIDSLQFMRSLLSILPQTVWLVFACAANVDPSPQSAAGPMAPAAFSIGKTWNQPRTAANLAAIVLGPAQLLRSFTRTQSSVPPVSIHALVASHFNIRRPRGAIDQPHRTMTGMAKCDYRHAEHMFTRGGPALRPLC